LHLFWLNNLTLSKVYFNTKIIKKNLTNHQKGVWLFVNLLTVEVVFCKSDLTPSPSPERRGECNRVFLSVKKSPFQGRFRGVLCIFSSSQTLSTSQYVNSTLNKQCAWDGILQRARVGNW